MRRHTHGGTQDFSKVPRPSGATRLTNFGAPSPRGSYVRDDFSQRAEQNPCGAVTNGCSRVLFRRRRRRLQGRRDEIFARQAHSPATHQQGVADLRLAHRSAVCLHTHWHRQPCAVSSPLGPW